jgi:nitroreductase
MTELLGDALCARFSDAPDVPDDLRGNLVLQGIARRGSCRSFKPRPVPLQVIKTLSAVALSSPSKSDLQQRDIVVVEDPALKAQILELVSAQDWTEEVPSLIVFCANNRRLRQMHDMHGIEFANDHLDAFFNASVDAGIALGSMVIAVEAAGLGCCPLSTIRNHARVVSDLLELPDHVFPVAALALGYPADPMQISPRLPLRTTIHVGTFKETSTQDVAEYDASRVRVQPYKTQRNPLLYGTSDAYTWSLDKARQYGLPERINFGHFIKEKGFKLD